jgi:pimeloyl-ACP methyl ester carboxylesterase
MQTVSANAARREPFSPPTNDAVFASFRGKPHSFLAAPPHRVAYRRFGRGPDVVFVHGWPLHSGTFRRLVPLLADRFTCHLIDLPGSGQTESPDQFAIDLPSLADVARAAIDAIGLERYALLAHDSGGFVARLVAAGDPKVVGVVSGDTEIPGHTPTIIKTMRAAAAIPGGADAIRIAMHTRAVRRSSTAYGGCFADLDFLDGDFHEFMVAPLLGSRAAWRKQADLLRTIDDSLHDKMRDAHRKLRSPVLLIWGDADPIFPIGLARAMVTQLPAGSRLEPIAGGKCFVHEERPREFAALAAPFLTEVLTVR